MKLNLILSMVAAIASVSAHAALSGRLVLPADAKNVKIVSIALGTQTLTNPTQDWVAIHQDDMRCQSNNQDYANYCYQLVTTPGTTAPAVIVTVSMDTDLESDAECPVQTNDTLPPCVATGKAIKEVILSPASFNAAQLSAIKSGSARAEGLLTFTDRAPSVSTSVPVDADYCSYTVGSGDQLVKTGDENCIDGTVYGKGSESVRILTVSVNN